MAQPKTKTVKVEDLWCGDYVWTHDGQFRRVVRFQEVGCGGVDVAVILQEPEGSFQPSIGDLSESVAPCKWDDEVSILVK